MQQNCLDGRISEFVIFHIYIYIRLFREHIVSVFEHLRLVHEHINYFIDIRLVHELLELVQEQIGLTHNRSGSWTHQIST